MSTNRHVAITHNEIYIDLVKQIEEAERDRIFCKHDTDHFVDVARIATILAGDMNVVIDRDLIYAAALVHDLGRAKQYIDGTPHEIAGGQVAGEILPDCGYNEQEVDIIQKAIVNHRNKTSDINPNSEIKEFSDEEKLSFLLYKADKLSRKCYECSAKAMCNWTSFNTEVTV